jgi:hypothetical protein
MKQLALVGTYIAAADSLVRIQPFKATKEDIEEAFAEEAPRFARVADEAVGNWEDTEHLLMNAIAGRHRSLFERVLRLGEAIGVEMSFGVPRPCYDYNGKTIDLWLTPIRDICHTFAHYLVAPESRRRIREFGWVCTVHDESQSKLSLATREREEALADLLGVAIEVHLGLNPAFTLRAHCWDRAPLWWHRDEDHPWRAMIDAVGRLEKMGYLDLSAGFPAYVGPRPECDN